MRCAQRLRGIARSSLSALYTVYVLYGSCQQKSQPLPLLSLASFFAILHLGRGISSGRLKLQRGPSHVASLAFTAPTALATLSLAVALLCVASGNLHRAPGVGSDVAHVPDLFSAATTPPRFLALCALAEADAATASSGAPLEERTCRRPLTTSTVRHT